jgi:hypothetical protein
VSAHRTDEYLQAARIQIGEARVDITLELTPGTALARAVFRAIDTNRDGMLSETESAAYATRVMGELQLAIDNAPLVPKLVRSEFAPLDTMATGRTGIRLELVAEHAPLAPGAHQLFFRNAHRPDVSAYLVNALVPVDGRIGIGEQTRDREQREVRIAFTVAAAPAAVSAAATIPPAHAVVPPTPSWRTIAAGFAPIVVLLAATWWWRTRARSAP